MDVYVYIGVTTAKVGVYAANIQIVTTDETLYDKTFTYRRRSLAGVQRAAARIAQQVCDEHGYNVVVDEDEAAHVG